MINDDQIIKISKLLTEDPDYLLLEARCPKCGDKNAYNSPFKAPSVAWDCPNEFCEFYRGSKSEKKLTENDFEFTLIEPFFGGVTGYAHGQLITLDDIVKIIDNIDFIDIDIEIARKDREDLANYDVALSFIKNQTDGVTYLPSNFRYDPSLSQKEKDAYTVSFKNPKLYNMTGQGVRKLILIGIEKLSKLL